MVSGGSSRRQLPGALLLLAGLGLVVVAGVTMYDYSQDKYRYEVSTLDGDDEGVFTYAELSEAARRAVDTALSTPENETIVDGDLGPELGSGGRYLLRYRGDYHCLYTHLEDGQRGTSVDVDHDCSWLPSSGPAVHSFLNLSEDGKTAFRSAFRDAERTVWLASETPPEFQSGGDAPVLGYGIYFVRYQGSVYELRVASGGVGAAFGQMFAFGAGLAGMLIAAIGARASHRGYVRRPTAILVAVSVVFGPFLLPIPDPGVQVFFTRLLPAGVLASLGVWILLIWQGVK
jgi:hypothetical protein